MPRVFVVVAVMVVIPIAFARLDNASRRECDQSQQETEFCNAQRSNHRHLRCCNAGSLAPIPCSEPSSSGDDLWVQDSYSVRG